MSEELDNDLKRHISEVFDNYEDPGADEGWMLLREKFPAPAKHRGIARLWWASAAAVFLLLLGAGLWYNFKGDDATQVVAQQNNGNQKPSVTASPKSNIVVDSTDVQADKTAIAKATKATENNNAGTDAFTLSAPGLSKKDNKAISPAEMREVTGHDAYAKSIAPTVDRGNYSATGDPRPQMPTRQPDMVQPVTNNPVNEQQPAIAQVSQPVVEKPKSDVVQPATKRTFMDVLESEKPVMAANKKDNSEKVVHFGVYAATYFNYAKGSDNQVNMGAGVSSDFRITKNLKLSTGVAIAQNSFRYSPNNTASNLPMMATQASLVANVVEKDKTFVGEASPAPELQQYNARLVGLDVPVNLKYEFNPEKSDTYISAGLSSGTFLNQSYTYQFNYTAPVTKDGTQVVNEKIDQGVGGFYFARTLNVAFGVGYPIGKSNRLVIEPFMKYPLDGLGAQQIKFGAGGVNLRFNFQSRKGGR